MKPEFEDEKYQNVSENETKVADIRNECERVYSLRAWTKRKLVHQTIRDDSCLFIQIEKKYMFQTFYPLIVFFSPLTVCLIVTSIFVRFESFNGQTNFLIDLTLDRYRWPRTIEKGSN